MIISVRVWAKLSMHRQISCSLSRSTLEVASSNTIYSAWHSRALAIPIFCRWPPESFWPASPTSVSNPKGCSNTQSLSQTSSSASQRACSEASGAARHKFSRRVPLKRLTVWGTMMIFRRSSSGVRERRSRPSMRMRPEEGSKKRMSNPAVVLLPQPESPTRAVVLPRGISKFRS